MRFEAEVEVSVGSSLGVGQTVSLRDGSVSQSLPVSAGAATIYGEYSSSGDVTVGASRCGLACAWFTGRW